MGDVTESNKNNDIVISEKWSYLIWKSMYKDLMANWTMPFGGWISWFSKEIQISFDTLYFNLADMAVVLEGQPPSDPGC